ncbi:MAG TPA: sigma-70 family RNA polymerase sigma factor [Polyangia bacterium]|nr:sigma-70 family RNA polymerase sigma factor [Polyangia bacterium]
MPAALQSTLGPVALVERSLQQWLAEARAAWPDVNVPVADFVALVASRIARLGDMDGLNGRDLYLVAACLGNVPNAHAALERTYFPALDRALRRLHVERYVSLDDLKQQLRLQLFVAEGERPPRLDQYSGRGELVSWLRVSGTRLALRQASQRSPEVAVESDRLSERAAHDAPADLRYLQTLMKPIFRAAFARALAALNGRQRVLLTHHYIDRLTTTQIAAIYGVHRLTATRWLVQARGDLLRKLRHDLGQQLASDAGEVDSLIRYVRGHLDITFTGLLEQSPTNPDSE